MCQIQLPKRGLSKERAPRGAMTKILSNVHIIAAIGYSSPQLKAHGSRQPIAARGCWGNDIISRPSLVRRFHAFDGSPPNRHSIEVSMLCGHKAPLCRRTGYTCPRLTRKSEGEWAGRRHPAEPGIALWVWGQAAVSVITALPSRMTMCWSVSACSWMARSRARRCLLMRDS